jgi:hypothetical protein
MKSTGGSMAREAVTSLVFSYSSPFSSPSTHHPLTTTSDSSSQLTHRITGEEVARFAKETVKEGFFRGEGKWGLRIRPTALDIDIIVLTFIILEKRRRDALKGANQKTVDRDLEEAPCEAGVDAGGS